MYIYIYIYYICGLLLVEVKNVLIQIDFIAKLTSTSRSEKCVDSNRYADLGFLLGEATFSVNAMLLFIYLCLHT